MFLNYDKYKLLTFTQKIESAFEHELTAYLLSLFFFIRIKIIYPQFKKKFKKKFLKFSLLSPHIHLIFATQIFLYITTQLSNTRS